MNFKWSPEISVLFEIFFLDFLWYLLLLLYSFFGSWHLGILVLLNLTGLGKIHKRLILQNLFNLIHHFRR
jgi:hypothetical protein